MRSANSAPNLSLSSARSIESGEVPVFLAFPEELRTSRRVTAFRDFVLEEIQSIRKHQTEDEPAPQST